MKSIKNIKVVKIPLQDVLEKGKDRYNSNNHGTMPKDYNDALSRTYFEKYKHLKEYKTFNLPIKKWMLEANEISFVTGQFPKSYIEELEEYCEEFKELNMNFDKPYFIRTENVSLKYGCYGKKLHNNIKMLVESIITCPPTHCPLNIVFKTNSSLNARDLKIYLIEPVDINIDLEFRVFICNNKVTAISQQYIYMKNKILSEEFADKIGQIIQEFVYYSIIPNIGHICDYTIDLAIVDSKIYFIELNCFGAEYAAGSALFHWIIDKDVLYGNNNDNNDYIEFRYTY